MLVIQQASVKSDLLPKPAGPAVISPKTVKSAAGIVPSEYKGEILFGNRRPMARSISLLQRPIRRTDSIHASRETSPLSSSSSSRSGANLSQAMPTSTPASTVTSFAENSETGKGSRRAKALSHVKLESSISGPTADDPAAIAYDVPREVFIPPSSRQSSHAPRDLARVWEAVANARRIAVICGAGISVSSPANIPDFRSAQGLFRKLKEKHPNVGLQSGKDLFDANLFNSPTTSACFYSMVSELKAMADAAAPTTFHHLLKRLDMEGRLMRVYTQNIDGLEEKAGLTFGLGEAGDSRSTLRALGKRKREAAQLRAGSLARSKSEPTAELGRHPDTKTEKVQPMFPRAVPLHGSLSTMTCQVCGHKIYLTLASPGPQRLPKSVRELSPDASDEAVNALDLLSQGEAVTCKRCETAEQVREAANLRSRGIGMMKVDVVLYNGPNAGAERIGDCVERDILGLRDPNETEVPESARERMTRERKERKEMSLKAIEEDEAVLSTAPLSTDDAFGAAFAEDEDAADARACEAELLFGSQTSMPSSQATKAKRRQARLKPLPPDLLIVAGTSLKVPGTKRLVREFAKACQARDYREYESESGEESDEGDKRTTRSRSSKKADEQEPEEEEEDLNAPIRTILLNYDFPLPHTQWEDVFDVWVQGDVQQAALGLWEASNYPADNAVNDFCMRTDENHTLPHDLSWAQLQCVLETERKIAKQMAAAEAKKEAALSQEQKNPRSQQSSRAATPKSSQAGTISSKTQKSKIATKKEDEATSSSPAKKKTKATSKASKVFAEAPPAPAVGLGKFVKSTSKANFSRVQSAPSIGATKTKKQATA